MNNTLTPSYDSCTCPVEWLYFICMTFSMVLFGLEFIDWDYWICRYLTSDDINYGDQNLFSPDPEQWKDQFENARGLRQSPINLDCTCAMVITACPLRWSCEYSLAPYTLLMSNDGYSLKLRADIIDCRPPILSKGHLNFQYAFDHIRFCWGSSDDEGSEHAIDNERFALELQAVHFKATGPEIQLTDPKYKRNSVLIISYTFKICPKDNPCLNIVISKLDQVRFAGSETCIPSFPLCWLIPCFTTEYYVYSGSLTYPPCTEGVSWIVQPEQLEISAKQVQQFRNLLSNNCCNIVKNSRPLQELNNRNVYFYTTC